MHLCSGAPRPKEGKLWLVTDPREADRQLKRTENSRVAAQRSRQKPTDKADGLHQEHEWLERDNEAQLKEIWSLQAEVKRWLQALEEHQPVCLLAAVPSTAQTHTDCLSQGQPASQTPSAQQHSPLVMQTPASPSAQPSLPSPPTQALDAPSLFSARSLSSPLTPFLVTSPPAGSPIQTHGAAGLLASSSALSPHLSASLQQSACLLPLGAGNLGEDRTENVLAGPSATPHPEESMQGWAWLLSSSHF